MSAIVKKILPVTNLSCASCAVSVESMLKAQEGVIEAGVNYANATAMVSYKPDVTSLPALKKVIQSIGYDLIIEEQSDKAAAVVAQQQQGQYKSLRGRAIWAVVFSVPLVIIGMFFEGMPYAHFIMWALATPVVLVFGRQFFAGAWRQARHRSSNMDTLVALSTGIAYLFSVFNTLFPQFWLRRGMHGYVYFEASAVVVCFILLGRLLEDKAKSNTSSAIKRLMGLQPNTVRLVTGNGQVIDTPLAQVMAGNLLQIRPGDKIPVDGLVTEGASYVDESMLSGEPVAVHKEKGAKVFAGTINQKGSFLLQAQQVGANTLLAHIIHSVQQAQGSKAPVQKLVDKIAGIFVPVVMAIAVLSLIGWIALGVVDGLTHGLLAMVTVLVIACPCALGLATPTAIMVGMGKGAENGILIKDAASLELVHKINAVVLDKTGTITEGRPQVIDVAWAAGVDQNALSSVLYAMEDRSEHPLAAAVVAYFKGKVDRAAKIGSFKSITGSGVTAMVNGEKYFVGSSALLEKQGVRLDPSLNQLSEEWLQQAHTVIWFANQQQALAVISITDAIKPNTAEAVQQLQAQCIAVYMLTGDNEQTAAAVAKQAGIAQYKAAMLPADKANFIRQLQQQGKIVAMVGDGINDSEALAQADVSIAMARGTDIAMDVATMTLMSSDLAQVPKAIHLSRKTVRVIRQNLFWAFIYNVIGIPLATGILYPINGFLLNPMIAGAAMALSSVSVVTNSLRLRWAQL